MKVIVQSSERAYPIGGAVHVECYKFSHADPDKGYAPDSTAHIIRNRLPDGSFQYCLILGGLRLGEPRQNNAGQIVYDIEIQETDADTTSQP